MMKTRRTAAKAMFILMGIVAISLYFSGTVKTIIRPKVQFLVPAYGQLTEKLAIPCTLSFTQLEEFDYPITNPVSVRQVYVRPGTQVRAGDVLFSMQLQGAANTEKQLMEQYQIALLVELDFHQKHSGVQLTSKEGEYVAARNALKGATISEAEAKLRMELLMPPQASLPENEYPAGADSDLKSAIDYWRREKKALTDASLAFADVSKLRISEKAERYIAERQMVETARQSAERALRAFYQEKALLEEIKAAHDGFIVDVRIKPGSDYDGRISPLVMTSTTGKPVFEAELNSMQRSIPDAASVNIVTQYGTYESIVESTGINKDGKRCAYISVPEELTNAIPLYALLQSKTEAQLELKSGTASSLVPASAVHGIGNSRYVFVIEEIPQVLGNPTFRVKKLSISVIDEANGIVAVSENLSNARLAYMEDRELDDGATVIGYVK